jgi:DNA-binding Xre family transcriptional regulator
MRRKNATNVYINKGVMKIYRSIRKPEEMQKKSMSEDNVYKIRGVVSEIRYKRGRK